MVVCACRRGGAGRGRRDDPAAPARARARAAPRFHAAPPACPHRGARACGRPKTLGRPRDESRERTWAPVEAAPPPPPPSPTRLLVVGPGGAPKEAQDPVPRDGFPCRVTTHRKPAQQGKAAPGHRLVPHRGQLGAERGHVRFHGGARDGRNVGDGRRRGERGVQLGHVGRRQRDRVRVRRRIVGRAPGGGAGDRGKARRRRGVGRGRGRRCRPCLRCGRHER